MFSFFLTFLGAIIASYIVSGIKVDDLTTRIVSALVLSLLCLTLAPIFNFLGLPWTPIFRYVFLIVMITLFYKLSEKFTPGLHLSSWWAAFWGALTIVCVHIIL